jgi:uncharacterized protein (TIGR00645 family)
MPNASTWWGNAMNVVEQTVERLVVSVRWVLAPLYLGMCVSMVVFVVKFFQELYHLLEHMVAATEAEWVLGILALIDNVLVANLVVMVLISGYETFVSPLYFGDETQRPGWLSKLDPGTVKVKLATSIVGISLVHLLGLYLRVGEQPFEQVKWKIFLHLTFIASALFLAYVDLLIARKHHAEHVVKPHGGSVETHPTLGSF